MAGAVSIILGILIVIFLIGIAAGILSVVFAVKKKYKWSLSILLPLFWLGMLIPLYFIIGIIGLILGIVISLAFTIAVLMLFRPSSQ